MHFRRGDLILAGAAALLAAVYALGVNSPHTAAQAVLSWGFVAAAAVYRTRPRASAVAVLVLLGLWAAVWLTAPVSLGVTPWLVFALLAVYGAERYVGSRVFGRAVLGVALAGALVSPVMWTLDTNLDWRYRTGVDWAVTLTAHWALLVVAHLLAAEQRTRARAREDHLAALREEERLTLARELHDVLAHSLVLIKVQANAGLVAGEERAALTQVRDLSSEALGEVRGMVDALRGHDAGLEPTAQLAGLDGLLDSFRAAGLDVECRGTPPARLTGLPAVVQLAAVRIISEALTNAVRHQVDARAVVTLAAVPGADAALTVTVSSTGPDRPGSGGRGEVGGKGLLGLAERARAVGGSLRTEHVGDVFTLRAELGRRP